MTDLCEIYFKKWRDEVSFRRYDRWCMSEEGLEYFTQIKEEEELEREYACKNTMDTIYWCWNCKYGCCEEH